MTFRINKWFSMFPAFSREKDYRRETGEDPSKAKGKIKNNIEILDLEVEF